MATPKGWEAEEMAEVVREERIAGDLFRSGYIGFGGDLCPVFSINGRCVDYDRFLKRVAEAREKAKASKK